MKALETLQAVGADVSGLLPRISGASDIYPIVEVRETHRAHQARLAEISTKEAQCTSRLSEVRARVESLRAQLESLQS